MLPRELIEPIKPTATQKAVEALSEQHSNAIPVFGGAIWIHGIDMLVDYLPTLIEDAKFYKWHESIADTCRRFCRLCLIDPALVEAYLGIKFEHIIGED